MYNYSSSNWPGLVFFPWEKYFISDSLDDLGYLLFSTGFLSRFSAHPNSSTFDSKLDTVDRLFFHFGLMKHFLQKYLCHLREKRKHGRCYIHGVIDSYNNVCFRWETEDLSSADEDVPTDDISVSSSSNSASPLNSEGKCNSQAVGWDSWVPSAQKSIFEGTLFLKQLHDFSLLSWNSF